MARWVGLASLGLLALAAAPRITQSGPEGALRGFWIVSFDREPRESQAVRSDAHVAGELALLSRSWVNRANLLNVSRHTLFGVYAIDFGPFGFDARPSSRVPLAGGRVYQRDSIEIELNPQFDHGGVVLQGKLISADSAAGIWYEKRSGGSKGVFVMQRR